MAETHWHHPHVWEILRHWADEQRKHEHEETVIFILTLVIAAIVGLMVVAFIVVTENLGSRMYPAGGAAWRRLIVPVLGALITGFLLERYFPNARGSGIPQTKTALFLHAGFIRMKTVLGKFGLSSVSLASGIALGREGPSVQIGAGIASVLGRHVGLRPSRIKSLLPIGASAALAAAFNTPIAAVLFTLEEVMGDMHARVLGAIVLSSATSWMVLHLLLGDEPLFHVPAYQLVHPIEFVFYALLGVVGGFVSAAFVKLLLWQRKRFLRLPASTRWFQPVAGGLLVGVFGWFVPEVLGVGYIHVSHALNGQLAIGAMLLLVVLKLFATATAYASGNAGGIFGPSLFLGAMMGGAIGAGTHLVLPDYTGSVGAYALVGMGAAFAGIIRVPLTSVIMIFEVTRDYSIIVPLMIANLISYYISTRLQEEPIYDALLHQDGVHLPLAARSRREFVGVERVVHRPAVVLSASDNVQQALATIPAEPAAWPVADEGGFLGMVSRARLERAAAEDRAPARVGDLLPELRPGARLEVESVPHVHTDHPVETAMRRMADSGLDVVPVISRRNVRELVGVISMRDALRAYRSEQKTPEPPYLESRTPVAVLGGVLLVLAGMVAVAGFLSYYYREERSARAQQYFLDGNQLLTKERFQEAIEQYRNALSISHSRRDRLALAIALEKAGRSNEAEIYFRALLRESPDSGAAHLGLARIAAERGDLGAAASDYHRAIYGAWPENRQVHRVSARTELTEVLWKAGRKRQAQAELLALEAEMPTDSGSRKRLARLFLDHGLPGEAADVYRELVSKDKEDEAAYAGLGEAGLAMNQFRSARGAFASAMKLNPDDATVRARLDVVEQILALDPTARGIGRVERYRRSEKLMAAVLGGLDQCAAMLKGPLPADTTQLVETARKLLLRRARPRNYDDAAEKNVSISIELWRSRSRRCPRPGPAGEPLTRLMTQLAG